MTFNQWLRKVFGFRVRASRASRRGKFRQPSRSHLRRTRLNLEPLEDRTLLTVPYLTPNTSSELIADISAANSAGGSTTITLQANTTFDFGTSNNSSTKGSNALPVITANITIVVGGGTIARTGSTAFRLFDVATSGSLTLENLILSGGLALGTGGAAEGGAIYSSGSLNLSGVTVANNEAQGSNGGTAGQGAGGGLYVSARGNVKLTKLSLSGNDAYGGSGGNGGIAGRGNTTGRPGGAGGAGAAGYGGGLYVGGPPAAR